MVEEFEGKNFDKVTLDYLNNFLYEFDALFGNYVSREEVIRRIRENLDNSFIFQDDLGEQTFGKYSKAEKAITLKAGLTPDELKSIVFHELIHCITTKGNDTGFCREYSSEELDRSVYIGRGINEGTTEYLTILRDEQFAPDLKRSAYPVLVENVKYIVDIIDERKYINIFLNSSEKIIDVFCQAFDYENESSAHEFIRYLDYVLRNEKRIRNLINFYRFRRRPLKIEDKKDRYTVDGLVEAYCRGYLKKNANTVEDYTLLFDTIKEMMGFFDVIKLDLFDELINKANILISRDKKFLEELPEDIKQIIILNNEVRKLNNMTINQRLSEISGRYINMLNDVIIHDNYEIIANIFRIKMMNMLYLDNNFINLDDICALSKIIIDRGLNFGNLSIDIFQEEKPLREKLYCMYQCDQEKKQPVGLVLYDYDKAMKMKLVDSRRKDKLIDKYNEIIEEKDEVYEDEHGEIIIKKQNGEYYFKGNVREEVSKLNSAGHIKSNYETLYKQKMSIERRIKRLEKLNAPPLMLEQARSTKDKIEEMINEIMGAVYGDNAENTGNKQEELDER